MQYFLWVLLACSITMSAVALLYMVANPILAKRYSEKCRYYAWLIIIVGLIVPFRPEGNNAITLIDVPTVDFTAPLFQPQPMAPGGDRLPLGDPVVGGAIPDVASEVATPRVAVSAGQVVMAVWIAGGVLFLVYHAGKHWRFEKQTKRWYEAVTDEWVLAALQDVKREMGVRRAIGLYQCPIVHSPMMVGVFRPRILLPTVDFAADELRFILKHELVHYKRKDLLFQCLVLLATAIHWFNPIVHLTARAIGAQCESSCDAEVVRRTDDDTRLQYSETIIGVVRRQSRWDTALCTNFYGGKKNMRNRIFSIMDTGRKRAGIVILCLVMLLSVGGGVMVPIFAFSGGETQANAPHGSEMIDELGAVIDAAGMFWEDWWNLRGVFAVDHANTPDWTWETEHPAVNGYARIAATMDEMHAYLAQYYTARWIAEMPPIFVEYDGYVYVNAIRAGFARPNWQTAVHTLVAVDGAYAEVHTLVLYGAWHRISYGVRPYPWTAEKNFTFVDGRIASGGGPWG